MSYSMARPLWTRLRGGLGLLLATALLAACGDAVTRANYDRLKVGQSFDEVRQIIGEPRSCDEALAVRSCQWGDDKHSIHVNFAAGKVLLYSAENLK